MVDWAEDGKRASWSMGSSIGKEHCREIVRDLRLLEMLYQSIDSGKIPPERIKLSFTDFSEHSEIHFALSVLHSQFSAQAFKV